MRRVFISLGLILFLSALAKADVIATYNYGNLEVGDISPSDSATISFGIASDDDDLNDPGAQFLFNQVLQKTGPDNYTFTSDSADDPNWTPAINLLADGANRYISPYLALNDGTATSENIAEFDDSFDPYVFPSTVNFADTPITSIEMDITNVTFFEIPDPDLPIYGVSMDISVTFFSNPPSAVPTPAAFGGGAALLAGLGLARRRRK